MGSISLCLGSRCKLDEFFSDELGLCKPCTQCPDTLVINIPCMETRDTICGLGGNFSFLGLPRHKGIVLDVDLHVDRPTVLQSDEEEAYWKTLAFALIGILSLLVVITTLVVLFTCHRFRNYSWLCKGVTQEQAEDAESGGYVIIHRFIPPAVSGTLPSADEDSPEATHPFVTYQSRNTRNGAYRPKRRLMNEYVDDVFESDDSAGSRTLRPALAPIPEKSDSDTSDSPHNADT